MSIFSDRQIEAYFNRIGFTGEVKPDAETLGRLQICHLTHIPYENLDILAGKPLSLDRQDLFDKAVTRRRGGFCFELQGLYGGLLMSLGFQVTQLAGRYMNEGGIQMRRHRVLIAEAEGGRYLCDVGVVGEMPRRALRLEEGLVQEDGVSEYRFDRVDFYGWALMRREKGKDWSPIYGFTEEPQLDLDFVMPCFYCEKHPDSPFHQSRMVSIFSGDASLTLIGDVYKVYQNAKVEECVRLENAEKLQTVLAEKFGLFEAGCHTPLHP